MMRSQSLTVPSPILPAVASNSRQAGFWWALLANVIWGSSFLASKSTLAVWAPFSASTLRFLLAVIGLWLGLKLTGRKLQHPGNLRSWLLIAALAATGFGILYPLQLYGLQSIPSSLSASIMLLSPLIVILLGIVFLREPVSGTKLGAIALGILGGALLLNPTQVMSGTHSLALGSVLTIGAAASLAASVVITKKLSGQLDPASITFWSMLLGLLIMAPLALGEPSPTANSPSEITTAIGALFYLALICSVGCFLVWNHAIAISSPKDIASTMHIKTPVAILLGTTIANEPPTLRLLIGSVIVAAGVWLSQQPSLARLKGK